MSVVGRLWAGAAVLAAALLVVPATRVVLLAGVPARDVGAQEQGGWPGAVAWRFRDVRPALAATAARLNQGWAWAALAELQPEGVDSGTAFERAVGLAPVDPAVRMARARWAVGRMEPYCRRPTPVANLAQVPSAVLETPLAVTRAVTDGEPDNAYGWYLRACVLLAGQGPAAAAATLKAAQAAPRQTAYLTDGVRAQSRLYGAAGEPYPERLVLAYQHLPWRERDALLTLGHAAVLRPRLAGGTAADQAELFRPALEAGGRLRDEAECLAQAWLGVAIQEAATGVGYMPALAPTPTSPLGGASRNRVRPVGNSQWREFWHASLSRSLQASAAEAARAMGPAAGRWVLAQQQPNRAVRRLELCAEAVFLPRAAQRHLRAAACWLVWRRLLVLAAALIGVAAFCDGRRVVARFDWAWRDLALVWGLSLVPATLVAGLVTVVLLVPADAHEPGRWRWLCGATVGAAAPTVALWLAFRRLAGSYAAKYPDDDPVAASRRYWRLAWRPCALASAALLVLLSLGMVVTAAAERRAVGTALARLPVDERTALRRALATADQQAPELEPPAWPPIGGGPAGLEYRVPEPPVGVPVRNRR